MATATKITGVSSGIRISLSIVIAIALAIFIMLWDSGTIYNYGIPLWFGSMIFLPFLATVLVFGSGCLVQQLSCGEITWISQLQRAAITPIPFLLTNGLLYVIPGLRWPVEGLAQSATPLTRKGLSSGFYTFWVALYVQSIFISLSQFC